ncbi:MAG: phytanoyl-CoA dioxygenase family protein [Armatimonadetes bacterium]|nr:phytanoyl-CoA dioxygenase family protein [Armatimonadota bacterium]
MKEYPLTDEHIAFYRENGYVKLEGIFTSEELENLRKALNEVTGRTLTKAIDRTGLSSEYDRVFHQKVNLWLEHEGIKQFVFSKKLAKIALRLSGSKAVRLWHDHALIKMPKDSRETAWHQDFPYWPMNESGALSCWIPLDDVDENSGCLCFIPKSHKVGKLEPISLTDPQDIFKLAPEGTLEETTPVVMRLKAGDCSFHNGLTFHYAFPNRSEKLRVAFAIIYMPDGTTYNGKNHVCTDGLGLKVGEPITGDLFPILATEED